jgi:FkbM family methyltransferase
MSFNFANLSRASALGRLLRLPLALIPKGMVVRVLQGRLRGYRWIATASTHGCWLGSYELPKQKKFVSCLSSGGIAYDVGANVGFYTLLASACVGPKGKVFAFEPLPENVSLLQRHVRLNHRSNVEIHSFAVSDHSGKLRFERGARCEMGRLSDQGDLDVAAVSLDDFIYGSGNPSPHLVKIDTEGAELHVLRGAGRLLQQTPPIIFLATHSRCLHAACCELLISTGYRLEAVDGRHVEAADELICHPPGR